MANDSGFRRIPPSPVPRQGEHRSRLEWELDEIDAESVMRKLDNPALGLERRSGTRKAPSFNPYDNGRGTKRR